MVYNRCLLSMLDGNTRKFIRSYKTGKIYIFVSLIFIILFLILLFYPVDLFILLPRHAISISSHLSWHPYPLLLFFLELILFDLSPTFRIFFPSLLFIWVLLFLFEHFWQLLVFVRFPFFVELFISE